MASSELPQTAVIPAHLGFFAIYNPSLGTNEDSLDNQIVYYSSSEKQDSNDAKLPKNLDPHAIQDAVRKENHEKLRQIGLAQGMVEFGRSFSDGRSVDTIETAKSRIILHELEAGWWMLASINLTEIPHKSKPLAVKGKPTEAPRGSEFSSREIKPAILLLGDLLQAHTAFLLHHASSLSALFVRTRRSKFIGLLARYWNTYLSTWNVMLHGNPANSLYGGIKVAACGELGLGVGEEERGSGEREVLEGFVNRIDGLVDVVVSKFGDEEAVKTMPENPHTVQWAPPTAPWLGSGNEPAAEDGVIFGGTGALSRKSLRDVSHWMEDLHRWGPHAYGVVDNPSSNRRSRKSKAKDVALPPEDKDKAREVYGLDPADQSAEEATTPKDPKKLRLRPSLRRGPDSHTSTASESDFKSHNIMDYLRFGYGKHWSLGMTKVEPTSIPEAVPEQASSPSGVDRPHDRRRIDEGLTETAMYPKDDRQGYYLIGLLGDVDSSYSPEESGEEEDASMPESRLLLRTLTLELEREIDAKPEKEISIDLGSTENDRLSLDQQGSEHTSNSKNSFESQDRNKSKKLRVVVYVKKPFIFVFLFELRTDTLALKGLYRSIHHQIGPLIKPLLASTLFRSPKPDIGGEEYGTEIYDLQWDPRLLTIHSTIPNIPDPNINYDTPPPWTRIEAVSTHIQILNTYISTTISPEQLERTCKTSRGWWVVWTRIPNEPAALASGKVSVPDPIEEDISTSDSISLPTPHTLKRSPSRGKKSKGSSTMGSFLSTAHPFLDTPSSPMEGGVVKPMEKDIFLVRRAGNHGDSRSSRFSGRTEGDEAGGGGLGGGIGVDTKRYIEGLLSLAR
ncbi:hypothetical protein BJ878DRAFT_521696 [Calycina marina]|uniref:CCZ1/INTU/HSP4 first Longin domain-containing protein n=1 Tax=Calycina marina TaxID=1763456 RepID=A0A9P7YX10_9HELO|nr:hypothetical protein BJ878DRAFT_521696 [Calycina marina]